MDSLLREAGEALFGPLWQSELARQLGVSDRTMRRWLAGTQSPPAGVWLDMLRLAQERSAALKAIEPRIAAMVK